MLELRRLRLLRELHDRGTIAAVADALQFTPSAVSQQLAMLERETGVRLLERAGRGVRLTDPALVLVEHAEALLERAALAEADLAAAAGTVTGRARIAAFQSVALQIAIPAIAAAGTTPRLRCELIEAEPEQALPALALGDLDLVLGDEWQHQPWRLPAGLDRHDLLDDPVGARPAARTPSTRAERRSPATPWADRPPGHGVGRDDPAHLPRARRLRARHPPPHQRRRRSASRSSPAASRSRCSRGSRSPPGAETLRGPAPVPRDRRRHPRHRRRAPVDAGAAGRRA